MQVSYRIPVSPSCKVSTRLARVKPARNGDGEVNFADAGGRGEGAGRALKWHAQW